MSAVLPFSPRDAESDELPASLALELFIRDPEVIAELWSFAEGEARDEFAVKALRIGVLALRQARGQLDGELIRRESDRLLTALQSRLEEHAKVVHDRTTLTLKEYFDPQSGRFQERLDRLVRRDGDLEQVLQRQLGAEDSELARTLTQHFGQESQLLQWLNPDESRGLLGALRETLGDQLTAQRDHVLKQFSLDNKEGALTRFIDELTQRHGNLTEDLQGRIDAIAKQFSFDDEDSALSRMVANVDRAQRTITREFSLDDDASALARLKREMFGVLEAQQKLNLSFQEEVKLALQAMAARKQEAAKSTRHGLDFEAAVVDLVQQEAARAGDVAEATGSRVGRIKNCKKGDLVIELGPESVAPGARIVVEAKEEAGYQEKDAIAELEEARKNRDATTGLFIFSRRTAPVAADPIWRRKDDVFVIWDLDDPQSDLYLKLAVSLCRALAVRQQLRNDSQSADLQALEAAILHIEKATGGLDELQTSATQVSTHGEKMLKRIELIRKELLKQIEVLREKTAGLKTSDEV